MEIGTLGINPFKDISTESDSIEIVQSDSNKQVFNKLKAPTSKFLNYLIQNIIKKGDTWLLFDTEVREVYMTETKTLHHATVNSCLKDLRDNKIIAYTNIKGYYWINSNIIR